MSMTVRKMIQALEEIGKEHGYDLPIVGGYLIDDVSPSKITVITKEGDEYEKGRGAPEGVFIE